MQRKKADIIECPTINHDATETATAIPILTKTSDFLLKSPFQSLASSQIIGECETIMNKISKNIFKIYF